MWVDMRGFLSDGCIERVDLRESGLMELDMLRLGLI